MNEIHWIYLFFKKYLVRIMNKIKIYKWNHYLFFVSSILYIPSNEEIFTVSFWNSRIQKSTSINFWKQTKKTKTKEKKMPTILLFDTSLTLGRKLSSLASQTLFDFAKRGLPFLIPIWKLYLISSFLNNNVKKKRCLIFSSAFEGECSNREL